MLDPGVPYLKHAKEHHWKGFLEEVTGAELWTAHRFITSPVGDGGKARIPSLQVAEEDGVVRSVTSNEEKGAVFCCMFFPEKPTEPLVPPDPEYLVLGKFGPGPIGTQSGPDQTQRSWSWSGISPKSPNCLVSGLDIPTLPETVSDPVWTGTV